MAMMTMMTMLIRRMIRRRMMAMMIRRRMKNRTKTWPTMI